MYIQNKFYGIFHVIFFLHTYEFIKYGDVSVDTWQAFLFEYMVTYDTFV